MSLASPKPHWIDHPSEHLSQSLATAVEGALWRFDPIRQTNTRIEISAHEGVVTLEGNIRSAMMKLVAAHLAASVPGVRQVINQLVSDPEIEREMAMRMAMDPEVEVTTDKVSVSVQAGSLVLGGRVFAETQDAADALRARIAGLAEGIAGLQALINGIEAIEGDESAFVVTADVIEEEVGAKKAVGPKKMGTLIPDPLKDKLRAMIKARAEARAAAAG